MDSSPSIIIIGGGIIGLAVAELASRSGYSVTLLEKEPTWATHQTGHNSGVIHAGPYYAPGSLKAVMCTVGNSSMVRFAEENGIQHDVCGKLIVAVTEEEIPRLEVLAQRAAANGTHSRMISASEAREYEPEVSAVQALRVESTGIINYTDVSNALAQLAQKQGADLMTNAEVTGIRQQNDKTHVVHSQGEVTADFLINCAGLQSDRIARMAGLTPEARIVPFRGEYYELTPERRHLVRGLIYPVPDPELPFLGVHLTKMINGSVHAGPNAVLALAREGYTWKDISVKDSFESMTYPGFLRLASKNITNGAGEIIRSLSRRVFARSLARLVPDITSADLLPSASGIRAQALLRDGSLADDFIIQRMANQLHVLNAPSPAATSSLEIAKNIVGRL
ncbi:L-2-hydroxyglutarate oxidase [Lysinibacter sp. HNR]|uniref:L-2-hydroxyglutarate oxidase n=1 Tax=Lysinibacter sp. HNR TaxID=3031408 RepID=UPI002435137D|nr:L-2-hydroxyglutarate oxidase [Lysinibacter sp. HNR]WGD38082.1 L-2-hydroxyglutarate oxidase [Lysinibacter sp. HNR]